MNFYCDYCGFSNGCNYFADGIKILKGQVFRVIAGFYDIKSGAKKYRVRGSGNLRKRNESPLVGDFVEFVPKGFLSKILPRRNFLIRPKVANLDQIILMSSVFKPKFNSKLIDKFLALIESKNIDPIIVLTKTDLGKLDLIEDYKKMGYKVFLVSNETKHGVKELQKVLEKKLTAFAGQSGVGKTSTINSLTNLNYETQEISKALGRGKHTTRVTQIIEWNNGYLIDTPGFSIFDLDLEKEDLAQSFNLWKKYTVKCKFRSCLHDAEPHCEIKRQLKLNNIPAFRYENYLKLLKESKEREKIY